MVNALSSVVRYAMKPLLLALFSFVTTLASAVTEGETEHFYYRMPSAEEPYIDTQRGSRMFAFKGTQIMLSDDCGKT